MPDRDGGLMIWGGPSALCVITVERTPWRVEVPQEFLFGGGAHAIDCLRWFAGDVSEVGAYAANSGVILGYPANDIWTLILKFASGALGRVLVMCGSVNSPHRIHQRVQVYGSKGTIIGLDLGIDGEPDHSTLDAPPLDIDGGLIEGHAAELVPYFYKMAECIENDQEPEPGVVDGARGIAVAVAAQESLETGMPVNARNDF